MTKQQAPARQAFEAGAAFPDYDTLPTIVIGQQYVFYAEMQQDYEPAAERMRNYTGQKVTVLSLVQEHNADESTAPLYAVRAANGREFHAWEEELNGWDFALGQYFWPDGTYGPNRETTFLSNERE